MDILFASHQAEVALAATQRRASLTAGDLCELKNDRSSAYMVLAAAVSGMSAQKKANRAGDRQVSGGHQSGKASKEIGTPGRCSKQSGPEGST